MRRDSRLSVALHALLHLEELGRVVTSEELAPMMATHPVVVRRTMGGLRQAGIVRSSKGHGGGWSLARPLADVTLGDVHGALGGESPFGIGPRTDDPPCQVERAVNRALGAALLEAEALLLRRLAAVSLATIARDVHHRGARRPRRGPP